MRWNGVVLSLLLGVSLRAGAAPPVGHRYIAQGSGHIVIVNRAGVVEWEAPCATMAHDLQVLPNGNVLFPIDGATVVEMRPDKKVVWQYTVRPAAPYAGPVELHSFQRLANGLTVVAETGNRRIVEVDSRSRIVRETPMPVDTPNSHRDARRVRKLKNGNYLVCNEGDGKVRELAPDGRVVWSYTLQLQGGKPRSEEHTGHGTAVFCALRLPSGNTLIGGGNNNRVFEVTPAGQTVWSLEQDELPGIHLCWVTSVQALPNGSIMLCNTFGGPGSPQIIEVTRDKRVVWSVKDAALLGNEVCAAAILDARGPAIR